jgi:hypothetical protein
MAYVLFYQRRLEKTDAESCINRNYIGTRDRKVLSPSLQRHGDITKLLLTMNYTFRPCHF